MVWQISPSAERQRSYDMYTDLYLYKVDAFIIEYMIHAEIVDGLW